MDKISIDELCKNLDEALETFKDEIKADFDDYSNKPATNADISKLARQTLYMQAAFKDELLKYLKEKR